MFEQIRQIVQANDPILNNLANTENKLNELKQEVSVILKDYQAVNTSETSFFNFDNPFFILTLVGLVMLVFALWFLRQELKYGKNKAAINSIIEIKPKAEATECKSFHVATGVTTEATECKSFHVAKPTVSKTELRYPSRANSQKSTGRKIQVVKIK